MKYTLFNGRAGKFITRNIVDFFQGFLPVTQPYPAAKNGKRILIFNWRDTKHRFSGGAEVYIHEIAKRWVNDGHQVTIFCGNDGNTKRNDVINGVHIVRRGGFYFVYVWAFFYYLLHFRGKVDVVIDSQNGIPFFTPLYVKEPVYSLLFHVHQEVFRASLVKPLADLASFLEKTCMPKVYKDTPFLTISESSRREIINLGLGKKGITIVYPGVDLEKMVPGTKSPFPTVLYLGRLKQYKRIDVLLHAASKILEKNDSVRFIIAGDGEYKKNLKKMAERLGIEQRVEFLGKVTEEEKISLYQQAWVVINPSMMEGWGITTIEANACGTPVIASDVPGLRDSVKNGYNGYVFALGDHQQLAEKIELILNHSYHRRIIANDARAWAQRFNWEKSSHKFLATITNTQMPLTITVGIPAFNEEKNISQLVNAILRQHENGCRIVNILVVSDGSTDSTVQKVKKIPDARITVLEDNKRLGKSARVNQILQHFSTDVLFLLDADITITDPDLFANVLSGADMRSTGITVVKADPLPGRNFFENCINHSVKLQNDIREKWRGGDNYLSFRGCFMAIHKTAAKHLLLHESIYNNDAYMYFQAKKSGFLPQYIKTLHINYRSPSSLADHIKQSSRFQNSAIELQRFFSDNLASEYSIPKTLLIFLLIKNFLRHPVYFLGYIGIFLKAKFAKPQNRKRAWNIAVSTKGA